jgi:ketosteroid isomerase-like protein
MTDPSSNAQRVPANFEAVAKGDGIPVWEACHEDIVWMSKPV